MAKSDVDEITDFFEKKLSGMQKLYTQMAKAGKDTSRLQDQINQETKNLRSMQSKGMANRQHAEVRGNIERRIESRDKTSIRMPNIANILAGGAQSPISGLGQMQRQASKPFKGVWDFQKAKDAHVKKLQAGLGEEGGYEDDDQRSKGAAAVRGQKKRAESGFGGNLMGKKMQGMIGKVGKFMESSKGQGMMAGGMMGASILTMIIKKAMEASPMLQQMLKIMNVAMTLFLRPIGDFIGGMLKPIMLFFLREVAIPMLQKGKTMIRLGEQFGKAALGLFLKPVETIYNAIVLALDKAVPFLGKDEREKRQMFSGIEEWKSEQKLMALAIQMGMGSIEEVMRLMKGGKLAISTQGSATGLTGNLPGGITLADVEAMVDKQGNSLLDQFKTIHAEKESNMYTTVKGMDGTSGTGGGNVISGMGVTSASIVTLGTAADTVAGTFTKLNTILEDMLPKNQNDADAQLQRDFDAAITGGKEKPEGWKNPNAIATDTSGIGKGGILPDVSTEQSAFLARVDELLEQMRKPNVAVDGVYQERMTGDAAWTEAMDSLKSMADKNISVLDSMKESAGIDTTPEGSYFNTAMDIPDAAGGNTGLTDESEEQEEALNQAEINAQRASESMETVASDMLKVQLATQLIKNNEKLRVTTTLAATENINKDVEETVGLFGAMAELTYEGYMKVEALIAKLGAMQKAFTKSGGSHGRQHGGMINESIFGIGESGQTYTFGEAGPEMVTPMFGGKPKGGDGIGPVNINVNIEKVSDDVDLEKLKPVIERALQEVHARRGMI